MRPVLVVSPCNALDFAIQQVTEKGKVEYYKLLMSGVPDLDVVSISPARHFAMVDQPAAFAAIQDRYLKAH